MARKRFYCPDLPEKPSSPLLSDDAADRSPVQTEAGWVVDLDADQARHARRVLRLEDGAHVEVFDGRGRIGQGRLTTGAGGRKTTAVCLERVWTEPPATPRIEIAAALPKGSRVDDLVGQLSQLGADLLIPMRTRRSVVDPRPAKLDRLALQAIEHARQCRRAHLLAVDAVTTLDQVLQRPCDRLLLADPRGDRLDVLEPRASSAPTEPAVVRVLIGPEGGFTDEEEAAILDHAARRWCFGPHVMRIETAAAAATAILRDRCF